MYDLTSPAEIRRLAAKYGFTFSKGLGQNFLTDWSVLSKIVAAAEIDGGVLEIGPGFGTLTRELAKTGKKVVSVEIDSRLIPVLEDTLSEYGNVTVINDDIMKTDIRAILSEFGEGAKISVAANLPYYITTPILTMLIESRIPVKNIVVMVQKEVADRIAAMPGTKDYGAITVLCRYFADVEIVTVVPASAFVPPPKVDSAVLKLSVCEKPNVETADERLFFRIVKAAFAQRRKTLLNCLANAGFGSKQEVAQRLEKAGINPSVRGETLGLEQFAAITEQFVKNVQAK